MPLNKETKPEMKKTRCHGIPSIASFKSQLSKYQVNRETQCSILFSWYYIDTYRTSFQDKKLSIQYENHVTL